MPDTPMKDAGYLIHEETAFLEDAPLDLSGSCLTAFSLGLIANMISKYGHVTVKGAFVTGEDLDWRPAICGILLEKNRCLKT